MIRACILGPSGRTGGQVAALASEDPEIELAAAVDHPDSALVGRELAPGVAVSTDLETALRGADVYIDFTTPASSANAARTAARSGVAGVIGTTGLEGDASAALEEAAAAIPLVVAPNFSLGVNLLFALAETAARALGPEFDMEVVEIHHKRKQDAPSGTAIALAKALADGRGLDFEAAHRYAREGQVGARPDGEIGVAAVRGGDVVGEHTAYLIGLNERIEISHRAASRAIFAAGALRAAAWVVGKAPGRYTMRDVLGI